MTSLSIKQKLIAVLSVLSIMLVGLGGLGLYGFSKTVEGMQTIYNDRVVPLEQLKVISDMYTVNIVNTTHQVRNGNYTWAQGLENIDEAQQVIREIWTAYLRAKHTAKELQLVSEAEPLMRIADAEIERLKDIMILKDQASIDEYTIQSLYPAIEPIAQVFTELVRIQLSIARDEHEKGLEVYENQKIITIVTSLIAVIIAITTGAFLVYTVVASLEKAIYIADRISQGNLDNKIEVHSLDETGRLMAALKGMNEKLLKTVSGIREAASNVASGASQISLGNLNLSQRTEEQASSLEETASSMEEMTSTVKQNADNANQASQLAQTARDQAEAGGKVVSQAITAMGEINASSSRIADIISVVEEIAFQTNLLALNAAVEAARAGEQGRGFAVVASEVRVLAGRSADAAKEIKTLIEDSVEKVRIGSELVDKSGDTLQEIVTGVKKVTDIVFEIAAASQEQSSGIDQVNKAITQMDEMTQQNASLVEEAASASKSMEDQARHMNSQMEFFKLGAAGAGFSRKIESSQEAGSKQKLQLQTRKPVEPVKQVPHKPMPKSASVSASKTEPSGDDGSWEDF